MFQGHVIVTLKKDVMDPQGKAILEAAHHLNLPEVKELRAGRYFSVVIDVENEQVAREKLDALCRSLLANPVIETYRIQLEQYHTEE
jgi:phosphoribosylformylglycinamidine synthase